MVAAATHSEQRPIIEIRDAVRHFKSGGLFARTPPIRAVDGVTLDILSGETFAIVGESGCGKSTLARLMLQLIEPTSGSIIYNQKDLTSLPAKDMRALRSEIQFIFQDPFSSLNPRMTVGALIAEPLSIHTDMNASQRQQRVHELLTKVGLRPEYAERYPHEFSGGQRQRIGISRALACGPKLLIGDEPVSALDVSVQAQIVNLLEDLKDEFGLTLVIIAHDLAVIRHMSDRVAVMYLGEVIELADTEMLYTNPLHPYTQALISAIPVPMPGTKSGNEPLAGDIPSPTAPPSGCRFHTRCPHTADICKSKRPHSEEVGSGRLVACHRWREIEPTTASTEKPLRRTQAAEQRFALYRQHNEMRKNASTKQKPEAQREGPT